MFKESCSEFLIFIIISSTFSHRTCRLQFNSKIKDISKDKQPLSNDKSSVASQKNLKRLWGFYNIPIIRDESISLTIFRHFISYTIKYVLFHLTSTSWTKICSGCTHCFWHSDSFLVVGSLWWKGPTIFRHFFNKSLGFSSESSACFITNCLVCNTQPIYSKWPHIAQIIFATALSRRIEKSYHFNFIHSPSR